MNRRKWKPLKLPRVSATAREWERKALGIAQWHAKRAGLAFPIYPVRYETDPYSRDASEGRATLIRWAAICAPGINGKMRSEKRIRAVEWGRFERQYNTRADGRLGAFIGYRWVHEGEIVLPHWDWIPDVIDVSEQIYAYPTL